MKNPLVFFHYWKKRYINLDYGKAKNFWLESSTFPSTTSMLADRCHNEKNAGVYVVYGAPQGKIFRHSGGGREEGEGEVND